MNDLTTHMMSDYPYLDGDLLARLCRQYGTRAKMILGDAVTHSDLGMAFGAGLTEREIDYLVTYEWAQTADDILWRRTKLGLRMNSMQTKMLDDWMKR